MQKLICSMIFLLGYSVTLAQNMTAEQYIATYKDFAISEMKRMGVPASITLAQGLLETENGNSDLVQRSNNHFGIKCKSSWSGESVYHDDDERGECFRKYPSAEDSYRDHSEFLKRSERYAFLFRLDPTDYKGWAYGLKRAGYATNPKYPDILIRHIEKYNLHQYTMHYVNNGMNESESNVEEKKESTTSVPINSVQGETVNTSFTPGYQGRTRFNGLKAVYAKAGTSLLAIATQYDITLEKLLSFNDLSADGLLTEDSWIYLEKKMKENKRAFYTTIEAESVYFIAQSNGLQLGSLLEYNELDVQKRVPAGTKIWLQPRLADGYEPASTQTIHKVQPKEGLYAIAKKYNVTVAELKVWNNLDSDNVSVGQQLIISK